MLRVFMKSCCVPRASCLLMLSLLTSDVSGDLKSVGKYRNVTPPIDNIATLPLINNSSTKLKDSNAKYKVYWRGSNSRSGHNQMNKKLEDQQTTSKIFYFIDDSSREFFDQIPPEYNISTKISERPGYIGKRVSLEEYPYIVTIWLRFEKPEYRAVGTLISTRHVLTAAHSICWDVISAFPLPFNNLMMAVRVGTTNNNDYFAEHDVLFSFIHWKWWASKRRIRLYDIAILELANQVEITSKSALVPLTSHKDIEPSANTYSNCVSVWWGHQIVNGKVISDYPYLQVAQMKIITFDECIRLYSLYNKKKITMNKSLEICTSMKDLEGPCQGNTGGPLICDGKQIGILSWGASCIKSDHPQIFTNIDSLLNWINLQVTKQDSRLLTKKNGSVGILWSSVLIAIFFTVIEIIL